MEDTIKVCHCDFENPTPLLWTFKFQGAEYWCPSCGHTAGMMGAGKNIPVTYALKRAKVKWKQKAKSFLSGETENWEYETI